ncbi:MAG: hypothetical protein R6U50_13510, partial [Desulfobacterales bacterium]
MNYTSSASCWLKRLGFLVTAGLFVFSSGCATSSKQIATAEKPSPAATSKRIVDIFASDESESSIVCIRGSDKLTYTSIKQPLPPAVVLYFPETGVDPGAVGSVENEMVSAVETDTSGQTNSAAKISILLNRDAPYRVIEKDDGLDVVFDKAGNPIAMTTMEEPAESAGFGAGVTAAAGEFELQDGHHATSGPDAVHQNSDPAFEPKNPAKSAWVNRIDFSSEEKGKSTIIIGTSRPVDYDIEKSQDKHLKLRLIKTNIPDFRQRQLITTRFDSAVDRIIPVQTTAMKGDSLISIELREAVPYFAETSGSLIMVHFEPSSIPPRPLEAANLPPWKRIISGDFVESNIETAQNSEGPAIGSIRSTDQSLGKKTYNGEKIALDFYETDIKNVFRILREISGKNFIIDDDVNGKVTMTLDKPVPWDQIMDLVLKMN